MSEVHYNILFLSNRNSARSIFAEAVANRLGGRHFTGFSAGMQPAKDIDPLVLDILNSAHYSTAGLHPKSWEDFAHDRAPALDFVFTLCNPVVGEALPRWPGRPVTADWRYSDPQDSQGEQWQRRKQLGGILASLERQFKIFMVLPFKSLDAMSLRERLRELGETAGAK
jgi:arsenate reductase